VCSRRSWYLWMDPGERRRSSRHVEDLARRSDKVQVVLLQVVEPIPVTMKLDSVPPLDQLEIDREFKKCEGLP